MNIEAAPVAGRARALHPLEGVAIGQLGDALGLGRLDAGAANRRIQQAARLQGFIANEFGGQPQARLPGQQCIIRIALLQFFADLGRLPVGGRRHDEPVELLQAPPALAEFAGETIQQFRMRRLVALRAEILRSFDDAAPEKLVPHAIHRHARGERILARDNPLRQRKARGLGAGGHRRQKRGRARLHFHAGRAEIALQVEIILRRSGVIHQYQGLRQAREGRFDLAEFLAQLFELFGLRFVLGDLRAEVVNEIIGEPVGLRAGALVRIGQQHFLRVVERCANGGNLEIPIQTLAGIGQRLAHVALPLGFERRDAIFGQQFRACFVVRRPRRQIRPHLAGDWRVDVFFERAVEEGEHLVEILLQDGIVLVVVALRAADGQAQPRRADSVGAID